VTPDALPREGLPYWAFWLLIFVIVLLVTFIFLRDKDLRRRLDYLLSGGKRRFLRIRLRVRLRRERQKRQGFIKDLGQKAWSLDLKLAASESILRELGALEKKRRALQDEWQADYVRLEALHKKLGEFKAENERAAAEEEARKKPHEIRWYELKEKSKALDKDFKAAEKGGNGGASAEERAQRLAGLAQERASLTADMDGVRKALEELDRRAAEVRSRGRIQVLSFEAEIREWEKAKDRVQERIREVERRMDPLFESLGAIVNEVRPDNAELFGLFSTIDRLDKTIEDLTLRIESLHASSANDSSPAV
jgi:chromosome segregation ATPase